MTYPKTLLLTLLFTVATPTPAALLFTSDFESAAPAATRSSSRAQAAPSATPRADPLQGWTQYRCCGHSNTVAHESARAGGSAYRSEIRKSDPLGVNGAPGRHRAQLTRLRGDGSTFALGQDYWVGFSVYFPADYRHDPDEAALLDWHRRADPGEGPAASPLALHSQGNRLILYNRWDARPIQQTPLQSRDKDIAWTGPIEKGWNDFVFHVKFSYQADGVLEVWKNGQKIVAKRGPTYYNDRSGPYFKIGLYKWWWRSAVAQQAVYFDEVRIGDSRSRYQDVAPGGRPAADAPRETAPATPTGATLTYLPYATPP